MEFNYTGLVEMVLMGQYDRAKQTCEILVRNPTAYGVEDQRFIKRMQDLMEIKIRREIPHELTGILSVEDYTLNPELFQADRYLVRPKDEAEMDRILQLCETSAQLRERGINYLPASIFEGPTGCGKTMLARYVAYKAKLPFIYVKLSTLIDSKLGQTGKNIAQIFSFASTFPCVLCFDELDAIGGTRGQGQDVLEIARITTTIMQELDYCPSSVCVIGTTNAYDNIDPALARRFTNRHRVEEYNQEEVRAMAKQFFAAAQLLTAKAEEFCDSITIPEGKTTISAAKVVKACAAEAARMIQDGEAPPLQAKKVCLGRCKKQKKE